MARTTGTTPRTQIKTRRKCTLPNQTTSKTKQNIIGKSKEKNCGTLKVTKITKPKVIRNVKRKVENSETTKSKKKKCNATNAEKSKKTNRLSINGGDSRGDNEIIPVQSGKTRIKIEHNSDGIDELDFNVDTSHDLKENTIRVSNKTHVQLQNCAPVPVWDLEDITKHRKPKKTQSILPITMKSTGFGHEDFVLQKKVSILHTSNVYEQVEHNYFTKMKCGLPDEAFHILSNGKKYLVGMVYNKMKSGMYEVQFQYTGIPVIPFSCNMLLHLIEAHSFMSQEEQQLNKYNTPEYRMTKSHSTVVKQCNILIHLLGCEQKYCIYWKRLVVVKIV